MKRIYSLYWINTKKDLLFFHYFNFKSLHVPNSTSYCTTQTSCDKYRRKSYCFVGYG